MNDIQIMEIIDGYDDLQEATEALVALANKKGGMDNITCIAFDKKTEEIV